MIRSAAPAASGPTITAALRPSFRVSAARLFGRRRRTRQRGLQRGQGHFVDPEGTGEWMPGHGADQVLPSEDESALGSAQQFVPAGGDERGPGFQLGPRVRLLWQQGMRGRQTRSDVGDHRDTERRQFGDSGGAGESRDAEVGGMHLEDEGRLRSDGPGVVLRGRAVGRTHLAQPGPGGDQEVRKPEAVPDLHHLSTADHDLLADRQRGRGEDQRGCPVVDDVHRGGGLHPGAKRGQRGTATAGPCPGLQIELDVGGPGGLLHRPPGGGGQWRPAEIGVEQHPGRVDHRLQAAHRPRQEGDRRVHHPFRLHDPLSRLLLRLPNRRLDPLRPDPVRRVQQTEVTQQHVGTGNPSPRIRHGAHFFTCPGSTADAPFDAPAAPLGRTPLSHAFPPFRPGPSLSGNMHRSSSAPCGFRDTPGGGERVRERIGRLRSAALPVSP
ncbi:hypothetical protein ADK58_30665 [Streptomyces sp. XY152]|nr:hypothetical protein ADK58_30665 [Streptomyces sp. XY152]